MAASVAMGGIVGAGALIGIQSVSASAPPTASSIFILTSAQTIAPTNNYGGSGGDTSGSVLVQAQNNQNDEPVYQTTPLTVTITVTNGTGVVATLPSTVTIPTGGFSATFTFSATNSLATAGNFTFVVSATGYDSTSDSPPGETVEGLDATTPATVHPGDNNGGSSPVAVALGATTTYFGSGTGAGVTNNSGATQSYLVAGVGGSISSGGGAVNGLDACVTIATGVTGAMPVVTITSSTFRAAGAYTLQFLVEAFTGSTCTTPVAFYQGDSALDIANGAYTSMAPTRLLDTRLNGGRIGTNDTRTITITGVPANATAVTLNVTATDTSAGSFLTVYPAGSSLPSPSNLNWFPGETVANLVTVQLGTADQVSFYNNNGEMDLVVDLEGYYAPETIGSTAGSYVPLSPSSICDTRPASLVPTNECTNMTLGASGNLTVQVLGQGGVPSSQVTAVAVNVTATDTNSYGFMTVYPGGSVPTASNLNWAPGFTVANRVMAQVNQSTGAITIYNNIGKADVVVDIDGYFTSGSGSAPANETLFTPVTPVRILDTRATDPATTLGAGDILTQQIAGIADLYPFGGSATAVALNVTAVDTTTASFLVVYPGGTRPTSSDVNWSAGQIIPNFTLATLSSSGSITVYNQLGSVDVILDCFGYYSLTS
jgi:hypothetical protein